MIPFPSGSNPLPSELASRLPALAGRRWVLPSPLTRPADASIDKSLHGYEVHAFGTDRAVAERSGQSFSYAAITPTDFSLQGAGLSAEFHFVNEEEPDVWRVRMHVAGNGRESVVEGLLIPSDAGSFTEANSLGTWRSNGYGDTCLGPYGSVTTCDERNRIEIHADGSARWMNLDTELYKGSWNVAGGTDAGRLLFDWRPPQNPSMVDGRFGWEFIHGNGNRRWVLQTRTVDAAHTGNAPPIVFNPTMWLIRYDRL